ncbi:MAG: hypothetical protein CBC29_00470 [Methylococcaceae bacterium TMED69]|nr:MAG: hypothetical protein CBC29_00470 [Methylococcaceae bacterium TMED69]
MKKIAIIGAGATGLFLANFLKCGARVTVFEKSDRVGGRAASRANEVISFDHGAQFISVKNEHFENFLLKLIRQRNIAKWEGNFVSIDSINLITQNLRDKVRFVGVPSMESIFEFLSEGIDLRLHTYVGSAFRQNDKWVLGRDPNKNELMFDWFILAIPPVQASNLLPAELEWSNILNKLLMLPCISLMASTKPLRDLPWVGARITNSPLGWIAFNNTKPRRPSSSAVVAQSNYYWAKNNFDRVDSELEAVLVPEMRHILPLETDVIGYELKKWNYAVVEEPLGEKFLIDKKRCVAVAGDWCIGQNIEAAFESAKSLSDKILNEMI